MTRDPLPAELTIDRDALRRLRAGRPWASAGSGALNVGLYGGLAGLGFLLDSALAWPAILIAQGFVLAGFNAAAHDCAHCTHAGSHRTNRLLGLVWSTPLLVNFTVYKYYHLEHHRYTSIAGDTEPPGTFSRVTEYVRALSMVPFYAYTWQLTGAILRGRPCRFVRSAAARRETKVDAAVVVLWLALAGALTAAWPRPAVLLYWIPLAFAPPWVMFTTLAEHYGCNEGGDARRNTRTTTSNALVRQIVWNANYHAEHHLYPTVPSGNLAAVHRLVGDHMAFRQPSYLCFHARLIRDLVRGGGGARPTAAPRGAGG